MCTFYAFVMKEFKQICTFFFFFLEDSAFPEFFFIIIFKLLTLADIWDRGFLKRATGIVRESGMDCDA